MPERVLVIDDEPHMLLIAKLALQKGGFEVLVAEHGAEGIEMARREAPDLIVVDLIMPEVDGMQVLQSLKKDETLRHIPVLILTAKAHAITRQESLDAGAAGYITKPYSPTQLRNEARALIGHRSGQASAAAIGT